MVRVLRGRLLVIALAFVFWLPTGQAAVPTCFRSVLNDTKGYVQTFTQKRGDLNNITIQWQGTKTVSMDPVAMDQITRATLMPCDPNINGTAASLQSAPKNVRRVARLLPFEKWAGLVNASSVGMGANNGPPPSGFDPARAAWVSFLNFVGRYPWFCDERGSWASRDEACMRELVSLFANMAQETGNGAAGLVPWNNILQYTREMNCYYWPQLPCDVYATEALLKAFNVPKNLTIMSFYGRGGKQLSWPYNYAAFSAEYFGTIRTLVNNPDLVAQSATLVLGSALWFYMSPQNPKPSMHDMVTGIYKPKGDAAGITRNPDGSVYNKFMATVSQLNGAYECAPTASQFGTPIQLQQSKNRFIWYLNILNWLGGTPTSYETTYVRNVTFCNLDKGPIFVAPELISNPPLFLETVGSPPPCTAVGYQSEDREAGRPVLSLIPRWLVNTCKSLV